VEIELNQGSKSLHLVFFFHLRSGIIRPMRTQGSTYGQIRAEYEVFRPDRSMASWVLVRKYNCRLFLGTDTNICESTKAGHTEGSFYALDAHYT
jgi:hypothetical protein